MYKKHLALLIVSFLMCFVSANGQDGPQHSAKLDKENGFGKLVIGSPFPKVKSLLQPDKMDAALSLNAQDFDEEYHSAIYLVNLSNPKYAALAGFPIDRIEVWFGYDMWNSSENAPDVIHNVILYFKKENKGDESACFAKLFELYGGAYPVLDYPGPGDELITWMGEDVLMTAANYCGDSSNPNRNYYMVSFWSAKGG
jgi:hypothetical protein